MALETTQLKQTIVGLMTEMLEREENSIEEFAQRLSDAIEVHIKTATIVYTGGLTAPNGAVSGTFNGQLQ